MDLAPGRRLGRYLIVRRLGAGGMAEVYLARRAGTYGAGRDVALKVLAPGRAAEEIEMFEHEARVLAAIRHPHVARAFDHGVADGRHFLALEYVAGVTLQQVLAAAFAARRELPLEVGLSVAVAAAAGLHHAHEHVGDDGPLGIVHRDVTPSNILVGHDGAVKLIDFGIARSRARTVETGHGIVKGKTAYMSPEQVLGQPVDRRSDVFSLGVVTYEATTQTRAFHTGSEHETARRVVRGELAPPGALRDGYPPALAAVLAAALAVDPADRFATAAELGEALGRAAAVHGLVLGEEAIAEAMLVLFPAAGRRRALARGSGSHQVSAEDAPTRVWRVGAAPAVEPEAGDEIVVGFDDVDAAAEDVGPATE